MGCVVVVVAMITIIVVPRVVHTVTAGLWGPMRLALVVLSVIVVCAFWRHVVEESRRPIDD